MPSSDLIRWGGPAAMVAGVAFILAGLLTLAGSLFWISLFILGELLVLAGLVGFHVLQQGSYRFIGRAGFYTAVVAILLMVLGLIITTLGSLFLGGWLQTIGILGQLVGLALYGVATLQVRMLPNWCGIGFIIAWPLALILGYLGGPFLRNLIFGIIWLALGYALWSRREEAGQQPGRVR